MSSALHQLSESPWRSRGTPPPEPSVSPMSHPSALAHTGHHGTHALLLVGSDEEMIAAVTHFVGSGSTPDDPVVVMFPPSPGSAMADLLARAHATMVTLDPWRPTSPAAAIRRSRELIIDLVRGGAERIRLLGGVPTSTDGASWDSWVRFEAALEPAFSDLPVALLCPYDTRVTPPDVVAAMRRAHAHVTTDGGTRRVNREFTAPQGAVSPGGSDTGGVDVTEVVDPSPADARRAVASTVARSGLSTDEVAGLQLAVSEVVTNAAMHGHPPVVMRCWLTADRSAVVTVTDRGSGPTDPFAGLLPRVDGNPGGLGLWIAHQSCTDVSLHHDDEGFTVRLVMGDTRR